MGEVGDPVAPWVSARSAGTGIRYRAILNVPYNPYEYTTRPGPGPLNASFDPLFNGQSLPTKTWVLLLPLCCTPRGTDNGCRRFDRSFVLFS